MIQEIRTRFAPSPTGYLHIGGVRTALFSWLYAKHHQGKFILRIEDTDLERSTENSISAILDGMKWLGLNWDEGPYYQTQHFERYNTVIQQMLESGHAYRCYCSKERLEAVRNDQMAKKEKPRYDGHCRDFQPHNKNESYVIRFKNPQTGAVTFDDMIRGTITFNNTELDDFIIARSDKVPTYNFCVVVDDWDMRITDVIRGDDHINNTPKQINLLSALGAHVPRYAHVPMILGGDGKRLSKRHGAVNVLQFKEEGYLPEALLNYLARLGWSYGDQEIFSKQELIQYFSLSSVNRSPATFDEDKLNWINQQYLKTLPSPIIEQVLHEQLQSLNIDDTQGPALSSLISIQADRVKTLKEMAERSRCFFGDEVQYNQEAVHKHLTHESLSVLQTAKTVFESVNHWKKETIHAAIIHIGEILSLKMNKIGPPIRVAVTGSLESPSIDVTLEFIGKSRVLHRVNQAIKLCVS